MKNELKLRVVKFDAVKCINNILNRNDWGKKHLIQAFGRINISISMTSFNFQQNEGTFRVDLDFLNKYLILREHSDYIYFYMRNDTIETFERRLNRAVLNCIIKLILEIAADRNELSKYYRWTISSETIIEKGYEKELKIIKKLPKKFHNAAIEALKGEIVDEINIPYNENQKKLEEEVENTITDIKEFKKIIEEKRK